MANDLDAATGRSPLNAVPQFQGPQGDTSRFFQPFSQIGAAIGGFGNALASVGGKLAEEDERAGLADAKAAAVGSVVRDENGNVSVGRFDSSTETGRAQNAAALQAGLANKQSQVETDLLAIRQAHPNDPEAYKAATDAYLKTIGNKDAPEIRPYIKNVAQTVSDQHFRSLTSEKQKATNQAALTGLSSRMTDEQNVLYSLARGGGTNTPEFQQAMGRVEDIYKALGQNPDFNYPKERIASEVSQIRSRALGEQIVGEVDRTFNKGGKAEAQRILKDEVLNNPKLNLSDQERGRLYNQGISRLDFLGNERKAEIAAHSGIIKDYLDKAQKGVETPDTIVDAIREKALQLGDSDNVLKIDAMREAQKRTAGWKNLTDEQRMVRYADGSNLRAPPALQPIFTAAAQKYAIPSGHLEVFGKIESGFRADAQNPNSSAGGLGQFIDKTWERYGNGKSKMDPEANVDAMARLYLDNKNSLKRTLGRDPALWEIYAAHQQGAAGAGALLKDPGGNALATLTRVHMNTPGMTAGKAAAIAASSILNNAGKTSMTNAEFMGLWQKKVAGVAGGAQAGAIVADIKNSTNPYVPGYALKIARMDEAAIVPAAEGVAKAIAKEVDNGFLPKPEVLAAFYQIAGQYPEKLGTVERELSEAIGKKELADAIFNGPGGAPAGVPIAEQALKIARERGNLFEAQVLEGAKAQVEAGKKAMAEEPAREAFTRGWIPAAPAPLEFGNPQALVAAIDQRGQASLAVQAHVGGAAPTLFGKADMEVVRNGVVGGTPEAAQAFLGALGRLDNERLFATLADPNMKAALTAASNTRDPAKYTAVMGGLDALWRRNSDEFARTAGDKLFDAVQLYQTRLGETPDTLKKLLVNDDDGREGEIAKEWRSKAKTDAAKYNPEKLGDALKGWFDFGDVSPQNAKASRGFMADFRSIYEDRAVTNRGDLDAAKRQTIEKMRTLYTPSGVNNNTVMKLAPETTYRGEDGKPLTIGGSFDWMKEDLQLAVRTKLGLPDGAMLDVATDDDPGQIGSMNVQTPTRAPVSQIPVTLFPAPETQADIAAGSKTPRYGITYTDPRTGEMHSGFWRGDPREHEVRQAVKLQTSVQARKERDAALASELASGDLSVSLSQGGF